MQIEFHGPGQVCMAGSSRRQPSLSAFRFREILNGQHFLPIGPVPILNAQANRRPYRLAVPYARQSFDPVFFDFLTPAPAVSQLPPVKLPVHEFEVNGHTRGQAADPSNQGLTM
jgi:hypothetical protein